MSVASKGTSCPYFEGGLCRFHEMTGRASRDEACTLRFGTYTDCALWLSEPRTPARESA